MRPTTTADNSFRPEEVAVGRDKHRAIAVQIGGGESRIQVLGDDDMSDYRLSELLETWLDLNHIEQASEDSGRVDWRVRGRRRDRFGDEAQAATFALLENLDRAEGKFRRRRNHAVECLAEHGPKRRFEGGRGLDRVEQQRWRDQWTVAIERFQYEVELFARRVRHDPLRPGMGRGQFITGSGDARRPDDPSRRASRFRGQPPRASPYRVAADSLSRGGQGGFGGRSVGLRAIQRVSAKCWRFVAKASSFRCKSARSPEKSARRPRITAASRIRSESSSLSCSVRRSLAR